MPPDASITTPLAIPQNAESNLDHVISHISPGISHSPSPSAYDQIQIPANQTSIHHSYFLKITTETPPYSIPHPNHGACTSPNHPPRTSPRIAHPPHRLIPQHHQRLFPPPTTSHRKYRFRIRVHRCERCTFSPFPLLFLPSQITHYPSIAPP